MLIEKGDYGATMRRQLSVIMSVLRVFFCELFLKQKMYHKFTMVIDKQTHVQSTYTAGYIFSRVRIKAWNPISF